MSFRGIHQDSPRSQRVHLLKLPVNSQNPLPEFRTWSPGPQGFGVCIQTDPDVLVGSGYGYFLIEVESGFQNMDGSRSGSDLSPVKTHLDPNSCLPDPYTAPRNPLPDPYTAPRNPLPDPYTAPRNTLPDPYTAPRNPLPDPYTAPRNPLPDPYTAPRNSLPDL